MSENLNIKSSEIEEILGTPPRWIIRWGTTMLLSVVVLLLVGASLFRYPDTVIAPVLITAENPPSVVVARATGKPAALFVTDGQLVARGDTLGVIENPANHNHIFALSRMANSLNLDDSAVAIPQLSNPRLGEVQPAFSALLSALSELNTFRQQQLHIQRVRALERELTQYDAYLRALTSQYNLIKQELGITRKQFARDSTLLSNGVISSSDFEQSQANLLTRQQAVEAARVNISSTAIAMERLMQSIIDTRLEHESESQRLADAAASTYGQLTSAMAAWEKSYLLVATSTGRLTFMGVWSDVQEVRPGDPLFAIIPESLGEVQARMVIPFEGSGKVKPGQRVNIKLNGFSYLEFGMVEAELISISSGHTESGYPAVAMLTQGPVTSYGHPLPLDRELHGSAEITTEDLSLMQRLISPLRHLFSARM